jgi:hypothetical protein
MLLSVLPVPVTLASVEVIRLQCVSRIFITDNSVNSIVASQNGEFAIFAKDTEGISEITACLNRNPTCTRMFRAIFQRGYRGAQQAKKTRLN